MNRSQRVLPLAYLAVALALVAVLLPTALRPPKPPNPSTAEFNPDAPPEDEQTIFSELNRGRSTTAGTGLGEPAAIAELPQLTQSDAPPRACPHGWGNPPRQTFSLYAAPCSPAFSGPNGGATSKGVTATEVRVAVGWPSADLGTEGPVAETRNDEMNNEDRTMTDLQLFFNTRYQLWGRKLRLHVVNASDNTAEQTAIATKIDEEVKAFAAVQARKHGLEELARRKVVSFGEQGDQFDASFYQRLRPYVWNWVPDLTTTTRLAGEYVCKKLAGRPAAHAGDPVMQRTPRVLGLIYNDRGEAGRPDLELQTILKTCGAVITEKVGFATTGFGASDNGAATTAVTRLRQAGVTSVISMLDFTTMISITTQAAAQGYVPEWVVTGQGELDWGVQARIMMNQTEWAHAFGISPREIDEWQGLGSATVVGRVEDTDCYQAVQDVDDGFTPTTGCAVFLQLQQIVNGIQMAGPKLTPETFEAGLFKSGRRRADPVWSVGGGYGPGDYTYGDEVGEIWYDPAAPDGNGNAGSYRWTSGGKKFSLGTLPADSSELFRSGISNRSQVR